MSIGEPALAVIWAALGLLLACLTVFVAPRLAAPRMAEPPEPAPGATLVPFAGGFLARWHPLRTALFEILVSALFAGLAIQYEANRKLVLASVYSAILVVIGYIDVDYRLVLNRLSYPGIVIALATSWLWPGFEMKDAALGALIGLVMFGALQIIGRGALKTGDTKLAIFIGAIFGLGAAIPALVLGVILGGVGAAFALFVLRRGRKEFIAYAPYLSAGALLSFFLVKP